MVNYVITAGGGLTAIYAAVLTDGLHSLVVPEALVNSFNP